ncbi:helix-turn-helix transcriptional regulator [Pseudoclavibacter terrae]|uniref:helix-turn-helix transcriptional regulator n=1 Tax=Pseudoclavibacter terrae TaxID=1530195 RepID=UPI00232CC377|nr:LuxR C-terminal-related transcriptional regulator [Pseudoclavibacter terrae]
MTDTAPVFLPMDGAGQRAHDRPRSRELVPAPAPIERIVEAQARGDWESVTQLLEQHWSSLLRTSRAAMREVVNALPDAVLEAKSRWAAARQYLNFAPDDGRVRPARFDFEAAQPNDAGELIDDLAQFTGQTAHERGQGHFQSAATIAETAIEAVKQASPAEMKTLRPLLPGLRIQWATSLLFAGDIRAALTEFEAAYADAVAFDSDRMATAAAGSIALIHSLTGDLVLARSWLRRQPTALNGGFEGPGEFDGGPGDAVTVMGALAAANIAIDELHVEEARAWLAKDPGDEVAPEQWALRLGVASRLEVLSGDPLAQSLRNRAAVRARPAHLAEDGLNGWALSFSDVGIRIALRDVRGATEAIAALDAGDSELHRQAALIARIWRLVRAGEHVQAVAVMESVPTDERSLRVGMELLAAAAIIHLSAGAKARAAELFSTLTTMVAEQGFNGVLMRFSDEDYEALCASSGVRPEVREARRALGGELHTTAQAAVSDIRLTERERVVLRHLLQSRKLNDIAAIEHVSPNTVKSQLRTLFKKLGVSSRDDAIKVGRRNPGLWSDVGL